MNTVGVFAGRGDVILAMALSFGMGVVVCWYVRSAIDKLVARWKAWRNKGGA